MNKIGSALKPFSFIIFALTSLSTLAESSASLADPTKPLINTNIQRGSGQPSVKATTNKPAPKNILKGIFVDGQGNKAIIDSSLVKEGQWVNGYQVHKIQNEKVILRKDQQYKTLTLTPSVKVQNKG